MDKRDSLDRIITIPNALTLVRFALVGAMSWLILSKRPIWAMAAYLLAAGTDLLDGYLARRLNQISNVGKVLDPIADKLMTILALVCMFAVGGYLTLGLIIVIIVKESLMVVGGLLIYLVFKKVVASNLYGKIAAMAYFLAIMLLFLHKYVQPVDAYAMYVAVAMNIVSIFQYGYINIVLEARKKKQQAGAAKSPV